MKKQNQKQLTVEDIETVELKAYKDLGYDDSQRFEASLYINDRRVAIVSNDGNGGNHRYLWFDGRDKENVLHEYVEKLKKEGYFDETYKHYVEDIFPDGETPPIEIFMGVDDYINDLIDKFNLKKKCKRNTCFTLKSSEWGSYRVLKMPYSVKVKRILTEKFGTELKEILNERFVEPLEM
jgi:hypothetical protein